SHVRRTARPHLASRSVRASERSLSASSMRGVRRHSGNASFAAATARSTSAAPARGAVSITSSVVGLTTSNTPPSAVPVHRPSIHIWAMVLVPPDGLLVEVDVHLLHL